MPSSRPKPRRPHVSCRSRRGAVVVLAAFVMVALLAMVAFAVDMGCLMVARSELQRTADAAALAGAWKLIADPAEIGSTDALMAEARAVAASFAGKNAVLQSAPTVDPNYPNSPSGEIVIGSLSNLSEPGAPLQFGSPDLYNAVRVKVRRTAAQNGMVPLYFARVLGIDGIPVEAEATAAILMNIKGFRPPSDGTNLPILPITVDEESWDALMGSLEDSANDDWKWDTVSNSVVSGPDGIPEINIYPQDTGSAGNRGTLNIGVSSNSTSTLSQQILNGISPSQLSYHGGELSLDAGGELALTGDPGISGGIADELAAITGQPRIIPIFRSVTGTGNNSEFTIVKFAGVRIMEVELNGGHKRLIVQPANIVTKGAIAADPSTGMKSNFVYSASRIVN